MIINTSAYMDAYEERLRALRKHGPTGNAVENKPWDWHMWLPIVTEEVGEVARAMCELHYGHEEGLQQLREELIQVIAMTSAWVDAIDREVNE